MIDSTIEEACARAAYEVSRAYCIAMGDTSHVPWEDAPDWQRESAILGVGGVLAGNTTPAQSHACWLAEKARTGWRFGLTKDPVAKTHPCMIPYASLPAAQREKDRLFVAVVLEMAGALSSSEER